MPLRVAQQWHVLRTCRSGRSALYCLPRHVRISASRSYAQQSARDDKKPKLSSANSAIIVPRSTANTQPEDLISKIQPVDRARLTKDRFAVFLVTPSFASWLLDDETFLRKALRRTYTHMLDCDKFPYASIHALCAVVDKLPVPKPTTKIEGLEEEGLDRMRQPPVLESGHDGIAYTTLCFSDSIPFSSSIADEKAAISFVTSQRSDNEGHFVDTLRLPLANTVFQTGFPNTMMFSTWEIAEGASDLKLKSKQDVTHHGIRLHRGGSAQCVSTLSIPLIPLSNPRQVDASMGNILRRVIGPDGTSVSASQELEKIVPRFFASRGETPHATSVWALVLPKHLLEPVVRKTDTLLGRSPDESGYHKLSNEEERWEALWKRDPPLWSELVPCALAAGARLHRVLSGGGGWGKKAGLLSLDPVVTPEELESPDGQERSSTFREPSDLSTALQQVTHDDDYIQFFASPSMKAPKTLGFESGIEATETSTEPSELGEPWGWELGTIPSTVDSLARMPEENGIPESKDVSVFRHSFGALSEGGILASRRFKFEWEDSFSLVSGSKVDVPYSRFSAINIGLEGEDTEEDSKYIGLPSTSLPYNSVLFKSLYGKEAPSFLALPRFESPEFEELEDEPGPQLAPQLAPAGPLACNPSLKCKPKTRRPAVVDKNHFRLPPRLPALDAYLKREAKTGHVHAGRRITEQTASVPIRYMSQQRNEVVYRSNELLRQTRKAVSKLTSEYRNLLHTIRRSSGQPGDPAVRKIPQHISTQNIAEDFSSQLSIDTSTEAVHQYDTCLNAAQKEVWDIAERARQNRSDRLNTQVERISTPTAHTANFSAINVYRCHTRLRWQLGAMILYRQKHNHPHPLRRSVVPLEKLLVELRAFGINLFYNAPSLRRMDIIKLLDELEASNLSLSRLQLSEPAQRVQKFKRMDIAQQIERRRNAVLRQIYKRKGKLKAANAKIRKVLEPFHPETTSHMANPLSQRKPIVRKIKKPVVHTHPSIPRRSRPRRARDSLRYTYPHPPPPRTTLSVYPRVSRAPSRKIWRFYRPASLELNESLSPNKSYLRKAVSVARKERLHAETQARQERDKRMRLKRRKLSDLVSGWLSGSEDEKGGI